MTGQIYIIDDDVVLARAWQQWLHERGYTVRVFSNAEDGLAAMTEEAPSLLILDLVLDGMGGVTLLNELQSDAQFAQVPVVIISSTGMEVGSEYGVVCSFDKATVTPDELLRVIREHA